MVHHLKQITDRKQRGAVLLEFVPISMLVIGVVVAAIILIATY